MADGATFEEGTRGGFGATMAPYFRPRPIAALLLGISSGFPLALLLGTMTFWLAKVGIEKKTIGFAIGLELLTVEIDLHAVGFAAAVIGDHVVIKAIGRIGERRNGRAGIGKLMAPGEPRRRAAVRRKRSPPAAAERTFARRFAGGGWSGGASAMSRRSVTAEGGQLRALLSLRWRM